MSDLAIKVENLSKRYRIGEAEPYKTLREAVSRAAVAPFKWLRSRNGHATISAPSTRNYQLSTINSTPATITSSSSNPSSVAEQAVNGNIIWALKDVSFDVKQGEVLGIIGRNGAGKSTLLKILSRITEPTSGRAVVHGRVASLLEVGTGFHPELTGRDNVYMNGIILGMTKRQIDLKFDAIVDFSGVEKFIETPIKRYSSGMTLRLAFAVAAHLEPDILVVDEVLAVGDFEFQKKAIGKMEEVSQSGGRTVLFVSHNLASVKSLCRRGVVLDEGALTYNGASSDAVGFYQRTADAESSSVRKWDVNDAPGNANLRLMSVEVSPTIGELLEIDSGVCVEVGFDNFRPHITLDCTIELKTRDNVVIFHQGVLVAQNQDAQPGHYKVTARIPGNLLNSGSYKLTLIFGENCRYLLFRAVDVVTFEIEMSASGSRTVPKPGVIRPSFDWSVDFEPLPHNHESALWVKP